MNAHTLHALATRLAAQEQITHSEACSRLAKRKRRNYGKTTPSPKLPADFSAVEKPAKQYWWQAD